MNPCLWYPVPSWKIFKASVSGSFRRFPRQTMVVAVRVSSWSTWSPKPSAGCIVTPRYLKLCTKSIGVLFMYSLVFPVAPAFRNFIASVFPVLMIISFSSHQIESADSALCSSSALLDAMTRSSAYISAKGTKSDFDGNLVMEEIHRFEIALCETLRIPREFVCEPQLPSRSLQSPLTI